MRPNAKDAAEVREMVRLLNADRSELWSTRHANEAAIILMSAKSRRKLLAYYAKHGVKGARAATSLADRVVREAQRRTTELDLIAHEKAVRRRKRMGIRTRRDDVESVGHHGYATQHPPHQGETRMQYLRRIAERRRRYARQAQFHGEQGPGYDQRRRTRRRRRR